FMQHSISYYYEDLSVLTDAGNNFGTISIKKAYKCTSNGSRTRNNNNFFTGINGIPNAIEIFVENSSIQKDEFNILKNQIVDMRNDFKNSQKQSIETNKALIDAIIDLKITISKIEIPTEK
ncbi:MAG: hypothetical protein ACKV1O_09925, partial [Saprospiraceae bacterium]